MYDRKIIFSTTHVTTEQLFRTNHTSFAPHIATVFLNNTVAISLTSPPSLPPRPWTFFPKNSITNHAVDIATVLLDDPTSPPSTVVCRAHRHRLPHIATVLLDDPTSPPSTAARAHRHRLPHIATVLLDDPTSPPSTAATDNAERVVTAFNRCNR
jgi:hypothetical protein